MCTEISSFDLKRLQKLENKLLIRSAMQKTNFQLGFTSIYGFACIFTTFLTLSSAFYPCAATVSAKIEIHVLAKKWTKSAKSDVW